MRRKRNAPSVDPAAAPARAERRIDWQGATCAGVLDTATRVAGSRPPVSGVAGIGSQRRIDAVAGAIGDR